ncbi:Fic family protein [Lapillicoccus jejuensis]|uniref:Fido domain-containing protein n=1 Tax=Lapillicoccus jejuensis TaxID=402171 RepID=A0A542DXR6_9MICO|nr:Fic family protein [Lapillicoccus jejuensis]TQJ07881.1 hypothetical protein FB458_0952 [Lapillicoccus jejuensis]
MSDAPSHRALDALVGLPGVAEAAQRSRDACTALRFHEGLRRRIPEAAAESRVRGAWASAAVDGATSPLGLVRDRARGAVPWPAEPDPVEAVVRAAVRVTSETEHLAGLVTTAPLQVLARLHVAAAADLLPADQVGRPRSAGETCAELVDVGEPPSSDAVRRRLDGLAALLTGGWTGPVTVLAALAHAEVATARPFVRGNGLVARALERIVVVSRGLDPTGVSVPEAGHEQAGAAAYVGALAAYATGRPEGVALWLVASADAVTAGAAEGARVADAVRVGRLS